MLSKVFAYINQWQTLRNLMGAEVFSALRIFATIFSTPLHKSSSACLLRGEVSYCPKVSATLVNRNLITSLTTLADLLIENIEIEFKIEAPL